jgi:hypothetical protein
MSRAYHERVLADSGTTAMDAVYVASSIGPLIVLGIICWVFFRAARRNDERERDEALAKLLAEPRSLHEPSDPR